MTENLVPCRLYACRSEFLWGPDLSQPSTFLIFSFVYHPLSTCISLLRIIFRMCSTCFLKFSCEFQRGWRGGPVVLRWLRIGESWMLQSFEPLTFTRMLSKCFLEDPPFSHCARTSGDTSSLPDLDFGVHILRRVLSILAKIFCSRVFAYTGNQDHSHCLRTPTKVTMQAFFSSSSSDIACDRRGL